MILKALGQILQSVHKTAISECWKYVTTLLASIVILIVFRIPMINSEIASIIGEQPLKALYGVMSFAAAVTGLLVIYNLSAAISKKLMSFVEEKKKAISLEDKLRRQLPKRSKIYNFLQATVLLAVPMMTVLSIAYLAVIANNEVINPYFLITTTVMISYIYYLLFQQIIKGKYRTADTIHHLHYCIHTVRNYLTNSESIKIDFVLEDIINTISDSFRMSCDSICYVTFKGYDSNSSTIMNVISDKYFYIDYPNLKNDKQQYNCSEYSSIFNILHKKKGCYRYYICNNIKRSFKKRKYEHPCLKEAGSDVDEFGIIRNWSPSIKYKATLVVPVRHKNHFLGFLCIDSMEKGAFDKNYCVELAASFVDLIYILLTQTAEKLEYMERVESGIRFNKEIEKSVM